MRKLNIVKMKILPKCAYEFNVITIKIEAGLFDVFEDPLRECRKHCSEIWV